MNTKLDIVRFECDDVIATSGVCAHADAVHVFISDQPLDQNGNYAMFYTKCSVPSHDENTLHL